MNRKQINVIIAKRNRDEYLHTCLRSLERANMNQEYKVDVYVSDDSKCICRLVDNYLNIEVHLIHSSEQTKLFNKAKLLNKALKSMNLFSFFAGWY